MSYKIGCLNNWSQKGEKSRKIAAKEKDAIFQLVGLKHRIYKVFEYVCKMNACYPLPNIYIEL